MKDYMPVLFLNIFVFIICIFALLIISTHEDNVTKAIEQECTNVGGQTFHGSSASLCIIDGKVHAIIKR